MTYEQDLLRYVNLVDRLEKKVKKLQYRRDKLVRRLEDMKRQMKPTTGKQYRKLVLAHLRNRLERLEASQYGFDDCCQVAFHDGKISEVESLIEDIENGKLTIEKSV